MASLTKTMTCLVAFNLAKELKLDIHQTYFKVSSKASGTIGTTANLIAGQMVSIHDLLYGLMLPSGNDAAVTLAENFGERLKTAKRASGKRQFAPKTTATAPFSGKSMASFFNNADDDPARGFIKEMNT